MSQKNDNPADPFKKALAEATKTMANDSDMSVTYSVDPPGMTNDSVRLPQVTRRMTRDEVLLARGTADAYALRRRHHNATTFNRYVPQGQMARDLYEAMEEARCEAVGARAMPGTAGNIDAKIAHESIRKGYAQITKAADAPLSVAAGHLIRHLATGRDLPDGASNIMNLWRGFLEEKAGGTLEGLQDILADQAAFARLARQVIDDLGYGDQLGDDPDAEDDTEDEAESQDDDTENPDSQGDDQDDSEDSDASPEQSQDQTQDPSQAQVTLDDMADTEMGEEAEMPEGEAPFEPPSPPPPIGG